MVYEVVTKVSLESFRERSRGKKVVLLYPWTNYRTLFLTHFYNRTQDGLLYYRIREGQGNLVDWLKAMVDEFNESDADFGQNLKAAFAKPAPQALGEALAADLGSLRGDPVTLYIDELDRIPFDDSFEQFMMALVNSMRDGVQITFNSRLLMYHPWSTLVARGEAVVLGTEERKNDVMFTVEEKPRPQLEVYSLGRGYVLVNGQFVNNWDGALPRNLFFFFMDRPLVTRREIFETFWPDLPVKEATNVFHVTKRKISERISMKIDPTQTFEMTQYGGGFYRPSDKLTRHYDVEAFQSDVEKAMTLTDDAEEERLLMRAVENYKAPYLQDTDMDWIVQRREQLRQLNAQALISLGRLNKRRKNDELALGYFTRSLRHVPEREDIHREVMSIYMRMGQQDDARMQYQRLCETLQSEYNINPSRETQDLFHLIENM